MKRLMRNERLATALAVLLFVLVLCGCIFLPPVFVRASDRSLLRGRDSEYLEDSFAKPEVTLPLIDKLAVLSGSQPGEYFETSTGYKLTAETAIDAIKVQLTILREYGLIPNHSLAGVAASYKAVPFMYYISTDLSVVFTLWQVVYQDEISAGVFYLDEDTTQVIACALYSSRDYHQAFESLAGTEQAAEAWARYLGISVSRFPTEEELYRSYPPYVTFQQDEKLVAIPLDVTAWGCSFNMENGLKSVYSKERTATLPAANIIVVESATAP